jgi:hypothetical protein
VQEEFMQLQNKDNESERLEIQNSWEK